MLGDYLKRWKIDGLNTLVYKVQSIEKVKTYTRINVIINQRDVMNAKPAPLPDHLKDLVS